MKKLYMGLLCLILPVNLYAMEDTLKSPLKSAEEDAKKLAMGVLENLDAMKDSFLGGNKSRLCIAVVKGDEQAVKRLVPDALIQDRDFALKQAAKSGNLAIMKILLEAGVEKCYFVLCDEIGRDNPNREVVDCLFNACDLSCKVGALTTAAKKGKCAIMTHLLQFPFDQETFDHVLFWVSAGDNSAALPLILKAGASNYCKICAIKRYAEKNDEKAVRCILESGIKLPSEEDKKGCLFYGDFVQTVKNDLDQALTSAKAHNNQVLIDLLAPHVLRQN